MYICIKECQRSLPSLEQGSVVCNLAVTYAAEDAKQSDPQDEEDQVPRPDQREAEDEGDAVEDCRKGGKTADNHGIDLLPVSHIDLVRACVLLPECLVLPIFHR